MSETANILNNASPRSLVILDELAGARARSTASRWHGPSPSTFTTRSAAELLFATHYHELVELEKTKKRLRNASVAVRETDGEIVFPLPDRARAVPTRAMASTSRGLAGVPTPVLERAREILKFLEKQHGPDPGLPEGPIRRKVKSGRALTGSLFASLPDPILEELRQIDEKSLTPEAALDLVRRLRELAG